MQSGHDVFYTIRLFMVNDDFSFKRQKSQLIHFLKYQLNWATEELIIYFIINMQSEHDIFYTIFMVNYFENDFSSKHQTSQLIYFYLNVD